METPEVKKVICFCCEKEFDESEITKLLSTSSGKCRDKTNAENRFICKKCNHLPEYQKTPMEIIEESKEIQEGKNV